MEIDRIKEKAAQNPRKSRSEARISRNSAVGDSPNSPGRRERESWDSILVLPRLPVVIEIKNLGNKELLPQGGGGGPGRVASERRKGIGLAPHRNVVVVVVAAAAAAFAQYCQVLNIKSV